jgi:hypothetical protein
LYEAKKRYGLDILNYTVTSNYVHLLVVDGDREVIPKSLQLVAGKTAQEFNRRKDRQGAFWKEWCMDALRASLPLNICRTKPKIFNRRGRRGAQRAKRKT